MCGEGEGKRVANKVGRATAKARGTGDEAEHRNCPAPSCSGRCAPRGPRAARHTARPERDKGLWRRPLGGEEGERERVARREDERHLVLPQQEGEDGDRAGREAAREERGGDGGSK